METRKVSGKTVFFAMIFLASVFVIGLKLLNPPTLQIILGGEETIIRQIPGLFRLIDVIVLMIASIALAISATLVLLGDLREKPGAGMAVLEERKRKWEHTIKTLKEDEQKIYKVIIDSDGIINQSEILEKTHISKSNISRSLDLLESKGLVEKRRRGMGNVILLK